MVNMEQVQINPRFVVAAIILVSGLTCRLIPVVAVIPAPCFGRVRRTLEVFASPQRHPEWLVRIFALRGTVFHQASEQGSTSHQHAAGIRILFCIPH